MDKHHGPETADELEGVVGFQHLCLGDPLFLLPAGDVRDFVYPLDKCVAVAESLVHAAPDITYGGVGTLLPEGDALHLRMPDRGFPHAAPELVAAQHGRVCVEVAVGGHEGIAGIQPFDGCGTHVERHVHGGDAIVRDDVQVLVAGDRSHGCPDEDQSSGHKRRYLVFQCFHFRLLHYLKVMLRPMFMILWIGYPRPFPAISTSQRRNRLQVHRLEPLRYSLRLSIWARSVSLRGRV